MRLLIFCTYLFISSVVSARVSNSDDLDREECKNGKIRSKDGQRCCDRPSNEEHTMYTCTPYDSSCWVFCETGYLFPDTQTDAKTIDCVDGQWRTDGRIYSGITCKRNMAMNESLDNQGHNATMGTPDTSASDYNDNGFNRTGRAMGGLDAAGSPMCGPMPMIRKSVLKCSAVGDEDSWSCVVTCIRDHKLPNGEASIEFLYEDEAWRVKGSDQSVESMQSCIRVMSSPSEPELPNFLVPDIDPSTMGQPVGCKGKKVAPEETIGLIKVPHAKLGMCTNEKPLEGMVTCEGHCWSSAAYKPTKVGMEFTSSQCLCCQAVQNDKTSVPMTCEKKDFTFKMKFYIPTSCYCGPCTASQVMTTTEEPPINNVEGCPENDCD